MTYILGGCMVSKISDASKDIVSGPFGIFQVGSWVGSVYILRPVVHMLIVHGSRRYRLRWPLNWVHQRCFLLHWLIDYGRGCCILVFWRCYRKLWPKLRVVILQCYIFAKRMLVKLTRCEAFRLVNLTILNRWAIFSNKFTHRIVRMNAVSNQVDVCLGHQVPHFVVVRRYSGHILLVQYLLSENLLHNPITIVYFCYFGHHLVHRFRALIYFRDFSREENSTQVFIHRIRGLR